MPRTGKFSAFLHIRALLFVESVKADSKLWGQFFKRIFLSEVRHYGRGGLYTQAVVVVLAYGIWEIFSYDYIAPGDAIGALGIVAALMTIRSAKGDHFTKGEQFFWVLIAFAFFFGETTIIHRDRDQHDTQQRRESARQSAQFDATLQSFRDLHEQNKAELNKTDSLLSDTNKSLLNITGGNSFAFVVPQIDGSDRIPLVVWNSGDEVLSGVTLTIARTQEPDWGSSFYVPIFIGTIGPHDHAPVPRFIFPKPEEKSGQDAYWIMISAQNGTVSQGLYFRRRKVGVGWAYSYQVTKPTILKKAEGKIPKGATEMKPLLIRSWSDEVEAPH
jgi:hypothetical protein